VIGILVDGGERHFRQAGDFLITAVRNLLQVAFGVSAVAEIAEGDSRKVTGHRGGLGEWVLARDLGKLGIGGLGALLRRSKARQVGTGRDFRGTDRSVVLLNRLRQFARSPADRGS